MRCPNCNNEMSCKLGEYHYLESGLENVYLLGVELWSCPCGEEAVGIPNVPGLHEVIAHEIVHKKSFLSGPEIRFLRKAMGMAAKVFAELLGVDPATVSRWENEKQSPGGANDRLVRMIYAAHKGLSLEDLMADFPAIQPDGDLPLPFRIPRERWGGKPDNHACTR